MKHLFYSLLLLVSVQATYAQVDTLLLCNPSDVVQLMAPSGKAGYRWNPFASLDNPTISDPIAFPVWNNRYIVEMIGDIIGENLIENADFEDGNTGFESEYPYADRIFTQGLYGVTTSAQDLNGIFFSDCPDHTSGEGLMMVVDGSPVEGERVWCQTIDIKPNTQYAFSTWIASVLGSNPAQLQFFINEERLGFPFTAVEEVCQWRQFYQLWQSGDTTQAEICIINRNTDPNGNDFALDDFLFVETEDIIYDTTMVIIKDVTIGASVVIAPDCGEANGTITVDPTGIDGRVSYSIDGRAFQDDATFDNVAAGQHTISIKEETAAASIYNVCIFDTTLLVSQNRCPVYVPNVISRTSFRNERFQISTHPDFMGKFSTLSIFDRWGSLVYQTEDHATIATGWDGNANTQEPLPLGVYGYVLEIVYPDGSQKQITGDLTLF